MPLPHTRHRYRVVASVAAPCQEYVIGHSGCQDFVLTFSQSSRSNDCGQLVRLPEVRASALGEPRESGRNRRPAHRRSSWPQRRSRSGTYRVLSRSARPGLRVTGSGSLDEIEASRTAQPWIGERMAPSVRTVQPSASDPIPVRRPPGQRCCGRRRSGRPALAACDGGPAVRSGRTVTPRSPEPDRSTTVASSVQPGAAH